MRHIVLYFSVIFTAISFTRASHFRGGLIYWQLISGSPDGTTGVSVQITQRYGWRRDSITPNCDQSLVRNQTLTGQAGSLACQSGCPSGRVLVSTSIYCTDYSISDNWMVGEKSETVSLPYAPVIEASYTGGDWIGTLKIGANGAWEVRTKFNLQAVYAVRAAGNSSPKTKMAPMVNLPIGPQRTIAIPVVDDDGDDVRCRWASASLKECAGVCNAFPGAVLNERNCTIVYTPQTVGLYAVAIQIEDFFTKNATQALSSVPLQFLVNIYKPSNNSICTSKPAFVPPTPRDGVCEAIPPNATFTTTFIAESYCPDLDIIDISTQSPIGVIKSALLPGPVVRSWYVNITWTPLPSQAGTNLLCYTAVDSIGTESDTSCLRLVVGAYPPSVVAGTQYPTGQLVPANVYQWRVDFDRPIERPGSSSYIRFYTANGNQVFAINVATSNDVKYPTSVNGTRMMFNTTFIFTAGETYYITLDNGIASGVDRCGLDSAGVFSNTFWRFHIQEPTTTTTTTTTVPTTTSTTTAPIPTTKTTTTTTIPTTKITTTAVVPTTTTTTTVSTQVPTTTPTTTTTTISTTTTSTTPTTTTTAIGDSDCRTEWSEWTSCSRTCGSGVRFRERKCIPNTNCDDDIVDTEPCVASTCTGDKPGRLCGSRPWLCGKNKPINVNVDVHVSIE